MATPTASGRSLGEWAISETWYTSLVRSADARQARRAPEPKSSSKSTSCRGPGAPIPAAGPSKLVVGPGDNHEPIATIMLPNED